MKQINTEDESSSSSTGVAEPQYLCSFCGKNNLEVTHMVAGDSACICNECVEVCRDVIGADRESRRWNRVPQTTDCG